LGEDDFQSIVILKVTLNYSNQISIFK